MRRKRTSEQLAIVRERGLALLERGKKPKRKKTAPPLGRPRKIQEKQVKRLEKALDKGAEAFGYAGDYWTLDTSSRCSRSQSSGVYLDANG